MYHLYSQNQSPLWQENVVGQSTNDAKSFKDPKCVFGNFENTILCRMQNANLLQPIWLPVGYFQSKLTSWEQVFREKKAQYIGLFTLP